MMQDVLKIVMAFNSTKRCFHVICRLLAFSGLSLLLFNGCSSVKPPPATPGHSKPYKIGKNWYKPMTHVRTFSQRGKASWYGRKFHGRKTANGEIYNMYAMTAAHKTLPLGTYVRVHNLKNNRKIKVRINDRGPFIRGRIIDLSYTAAKKLGIVVSGTAPVEIVALGAAAKPKVAASKGPSYVPVNYQEGSFTIQIGAFSNRKNAERLKRKLNRSYKNAHISTYYDGYDTFYRVRVGICSTLEEAEAYEKKIIKIGYKDAFAIAEDK
jgi:rare lipoprotein A